MIKNLVSNVRIIGLSGSGFQGRKILGYEILDYQGSIS